jgi:protein-tyrosine phosphatase
MQEPNRDLNFPNLLNVRDLGGCPRTDGRRTRWRSILRADDLCRLNPAGIQALLDYGVRTVIDLRWLADAEAFPNHFYATPGLLHHQHISLLGQSMDDWRASRPPGAKEHFNCRVLDYAQVETRAVLQAIAAAPSGALLFHCVSGKDRTGYVAALLLALADVEPEVIAEDYSLSTEKLREPYLAAFPDERAATLERVRCPPEQIHNMLTHLGDYYGGVIPYLHQIGLRDDEINQLKRRLTTDD